MVEILYLSPKVGIENKSQQNNKTKHLTSNGVTRTLCITQKLVKILSSTLILVTILQTHIAG
ncbi:hypothetical protein THF1C08_140025 [Vibrio jasicida]|uniref:Uncharacterized protein n=1 Tax=Vibrio jasicida TaxID=766224 RepID=A0AAU9QIE9_9VIBR|nr:hypothetical protein THF1C08_140025 [Vibrio jasicida]CAH1574758.1 hypothetical protein THF1A12_130026 [Vibrio jasicida]